MLWATYFALGLIFTRGGVTLYPWGLSCRLVAHFYLGYLGCTLVQLSMKMGGIIDEKALYLGYLGGSTKTPILFLCTHSPHNTAPYCLYILYKYYK